MVEGFTQKAEGFTQKGEGDHFAEMVEGFKCGGTKIQRNKKTKKICAKSNKKPKSQP